MTGATVLAEMRARIQLSTGSATLLLAIVDDEPALPETFRLLLELLRATPLDVADLGMCTSDEGPARWVGLSSTNPSPAYLIGHSPSNVLSAVAFARLLNAERELLRRLPGPMVLVVSRATENLLRQHAPDFVTWIAHGYEVPGMRVLARLAAAAGVPSADAARVEEPLRFLHISDLHLSARRTRRYDQDRVIQGLITFLERDHATFPLDLLFVTGDLAHAGQPDEYLLVVDLLKRLMSVTSVAPHHVFVVPGNHDIDRQVGRWLLRTLPSDEEAVAFFDDPANRAFHRQKLAAYQTALGSLLGVTRPLGLSGGAGAVETVTIRGVKLSVASFNSAWFAAGDDDHGKLWIGEPDVERAVDRIADEEAQFAIALLHHPFDYLHPIERPVVESWFEPAFDLVLRGHLHQNKTRSIASQRGGFVEVAGPAVHQGSQWPNGCFLGEIRAHARTVRLRPYAYASGPDPWVLDTKVFPDDEKDGYTRTFTVPEKKRMKSTLARVVRDAAEAAVLAASPAEQRDLAEQLGFGDAAQHIRTTATVEAWANLPADTLRTFDVRVFGPVLRSAAAAAMTKRETTIPGRSLTSPEMFENALVQAGRIYLRMKAALTLADPTEVVATGVYSVAFAAITDAPVTLAARLPGGGNADMVVGHPPTGVIEVKRLGRSPNSGPRGVITRWLGQLDGYLERTGAPFGALLLMNGMPPGTTEPQVEHHASPAGRDILILRL